MLNNKNFHNSLKNVYTKAVKINKLFQTVTKNYFSYYVSKTLHNTHARTHNISTTIFVHLLTIHSTCDLSLIFVNKTSFMLYEGHEEVMIFCHRKLSIHNQLSLWMDTTLFLNCNEIVSRKHVLIKIIYESVQGGCTNVSLTCYIITGE